nr:unnamed protein product [Callosobruchus chinensis]
MGVNYKQLENIARISSWSNEEKACVLTSMLRVAAILDNISSSYLREHDRITFALKLRFGDADSAKRAFVNSTVEIQEYVAAH